jgi:hypothetical protein
MKNIIKCKSSRYINYPLNKPNILVAKSKHFFTLVANFFSFSEKTFVVL